MNNFKMRDIPIRNKELLKTLDGYVKLRTDDQESFDRYLHCMFADGKLEDWTSDEYLKEVIGQGHNHEGYPDSMRGYELKIRERHEFFEHKQPESVEESKWRTDFLDKLSQRNEEMMMHLGCRNQALTAVYPPNGYIAWHNNANASAWNFIFTYSETGKGHFKYWDVEKQEIVYMYDKPGWQCKAGYFGSYHEPEHLFYHSASTECWRQTVSFCFDQRDISEEYREEIIDEIMSE